VADVQLLELFPTVVGVFDCAEFAPHAATWRSEVVDAIREREVRSGRPQGQTDDRLHERPLMKDAVAFLERSCAEYLAGLGYGSELELRLQCCWATVGTRGDHLNLHHHPNAFLSGAFYLAADPTMESIVFRDPRVQNRLLDLPVERTSRINRSHVAVAPVAGRLLVFPSWLEHRVPARRTPDPRISLSFNMTVHGPVGSADRFSRATL
jgi:uncharacterized protein (TIGR02466 family)